MQAHLVTLSLIVVCCISLSWQSPCVIINEIYSAVECNGTDWIELVNLCEDPVDLEGYFLRPNVDAPLFKLGTKWKNCEAVIPGDSYLLLLQHEQCSFSFNLEGEIWLLDSSLNVVDLELWDSDKIPKAQSYARIPNGEGPFYPRQPSPGMFNGGSLGEPERSMTNLSQVTIQINEISPSQNKMGEKKGGWIELFNYGDKSVNLTGLRLTNRFDYPGTGFYFKYCQAIVAPQEYLVFGQDEQCSFDFVLGINDQITLWFDRDTIIDTTRYGVKYGTRLIPLGVSWGRQSDAIGGNYSYLFESRGKHNGLPIPQQKLTSLIGAYIEESTMLEDDIDEIIDSDCDPQNIISMQVFDNQDLDRDDGYIGGIDD